MMHVHLWGNTSDQYMTQSSALACAGTHVTQYDEVNGFGRVDSLYE